MIGSILIAAYSVGATFYVPHLFSSYTTDYGVIGAVLAVISTLFCLMLSLSGRRRLDARSATSSSEFVAASDRLITRSAASGTTWSARRDRAGRSLASGSTAADAGNTNDQV